MSSEFWIGMAVSAILGLLGNIFANLYHAKIASFFDTRKTVSLEKNKAKALLEYRLVADFHTGRKDWHGYLIRLMAVYIVTVVIAFILASALLTVALVGPEMPTFNFDILLTQPYRKVYASALGLFIVSLIMMFLGNSATRQARTIATALEDFNGYKAAFEAKWGPLEQPSPSLGDAFKSGD